MRGWYTTLDLMIYEVCRHSLLSTILFSNKSGFFLDDITHCALSEVTGQIVLGNRAGGVIIL